MSFISSSSFSQLLNYIVVYPNSYDYNYSLQGRSCKRHFCENYSFFIYGKCAFRTKLGWCQRQVPTFHERGQTIFVLLFWKDEKWHFHHFILIIVGMSCINHKLWVMLTSTRTSVLCIRKTIPRLGLHWMLISHNAVLINILSFKPNQVFFVIHEFVINFFGFVTSWRLIWRYFRQNPFNGSETRLVSRHFGGWKEKLRCRRAVKVI